jgi:hypothetical protein
MPAQSIKSNRDIGLHAITRQLSRPAPRDLKVLAPSPALASGFKKVGEQFTAGLAEEGGGDGRAIVGA